MHIYRQDHDGRNCGTAACDHISTCVACKQDVTPRMDKVNLTSFSCTNYMTIEVFLDAVVQS